MKAKEQVAVPQINEGTNSNAPKGKCDKSRGNYERRGYPRSQVQTVGKSGTEEIRSHEESMLLLPFLGVQSPQLPATISSYSRLHGYLSIRQR